MLFLVKHRVYTICPYTAKPILAQVFVSSPIPPMSSGPFNENVDTEALRREMESQEGAGIWQYMWDRMRTLIQSRGKRWLWEFMNLNLVRCACVPLSRFKLPAGKTDFHFVFRFFTVFVFFDMFLYMFLYF